MKEHISEFKRKLKRKAKEPVLSIVKKINKGAYSVSHAMKYGVLDMIWPQTYAGAHPIRYSYLFGKQIKPGKKAMPKNDWVDPQQPPIYFKINRTDDYVKLCIQNWLDIAYAMKADYYFVCDNKDLELFMLRNLTFPPGPVKFIQSYRKTLGHISGLLSTPGWKNATCAHITPFYHAKEHSHPHFWAIDADDTLFCQPVEVVVDILKRVQNEALSQDISVISLDMWHSRTLGNHWSWGIAFVNGNRDYTQIFEEEKDLSWITSGPYPFRTGTGESNLDWYFTYLKVKKGLRIESFYVENTYFIHWGQFLQHPKMVAAVYLWSSGKLLYPIFRYVHQNERSGYVDIAADTIKFDLGLKQADSLQYLRTRLTGLHGV